MVTTRARVAGQVQLAAEQYHGPCYASAFLVFITLLYHNPSHWTRSMAAAVDKHRSIVISIEYECSTAMTSD